MNAIFHANILHEIELFLHVVSYQFTMRIVQHNTDMISELLYRCVNELLLVWKVMLTCHNPTALPPM